MKRNKIKNIKKAYKKLLEYFPNYSKEDLELVGGKENPLKEFYANEYTDFCGFNQLPSQKLCSIHAYAQSQNNEIAYFKKCIT